VPWSRSPLNALENLVVADWRANNNKRDHLAAASLVAQWRERNRRLADDLAGVAVANRWESAPSQALGIARAVYLPLEPVNLLWASPDVFVPADTELLRSTLAA
jgi:hypothetical protein